MNFFLIFIVLLFFGIRLVIFELFSFTIILNSFVVYITTRMGYFSSINGFFNICCEISCKLKPDLYLFFLSGSRCELIFPDNPEFR